MIGADFSKFAESNLSTWSWRRVGVGLAVTLLGVLFADTVLPQPAWHSRVGVQRQEGKVRESVVLRWRDRRDPRAFTTPEETGLSKDHFGLAWLSGSTISVRSDKPENNFQGRASYELTDVLAASTSSIDGQELWVHEYMIQGARTGDMRRAVLHAAEDPLIDAVVVALNPVWLFHEWAIYTESNQRASIVSMDGALPGDWFAAFKYTRPSSVFGALAGARFKFVRNRYAHSRQLPRYNGIGFPLVEKPDPSHIQYVNVREMFPEYIFQAPPGMEKHQAHRSQLLRQTVNQDGESALFFRRALLTLAASEKPVLLYVAPLPDGFATDERGLAFFEDWLAKLEDHVARYGADNIVLHTNSAFGVRGRIIHKDIAHLHYGQGVIDEIEYLLEEKLLLELQTRGVDELYGEISDETDR
ncbi:MAG: hypothetical protein AAFX54_07815 [Pseudomonadota bacterium]